MKQRMISPLHAAARVLSCWCGFALAGGMLPQEAFGQANAAQLAARDSAAVKDLEAAIVNAEGLIRKYPDSDFSPTVMFQLVELYVKRGTYDFQQRMSSYEAELERFDNGELKAEPVMPRVSYGKAIEMGYRILQQYPTAPFNDKVVYRIALCQMEEGNRDLSREYFQRLLEEYPKSEYTLEANFRLGEYYFDKRDFAAATDYYAKLLDQWQNPFYQMSLYKLAWSYYNTNNYPKAISTFIFLIDDIKLVSKAQDVAVLGKTKMDLRNEAIEYLAQCFADYGGPDKARKFLEQFRGKDYGIDIFFKLADLYQARNFYEESTRTLEITLEMWPLYEQAPLLQSKIVENYLKSGDNKKAEAARENLVNNYGPGSAWLAKYPQGEVHDQAVALAEQNLYILGTEAQARAQESGSLETYRRAIQLYERFLARFPASKDAAKITYYLAESQFEIKEFAAAAESYRLVMAKHPQSEFVDDAAYNRILSHFEEMNTAGAQDTSTFVFANFLGAGKSDTLKVPNAIYPKLLTACNDFAMLMSPSERLAEVLMKYGESLVALKAYKPAHGVYEKLIAERPQSPYVVQAHMLHAQCSMENQEYLLAEKWARKVTENYPDSVKQATRAHRVISTAKFKLAEGFKERGEFAVAAKAFENIAATTPDSTIGELAFAESAVQYDKSGDKEKAIEIYEKFYLKFPSSARMDEALFRAATLCEEAQKWTRASQNYLALVNARPTSPYAAKAMFAAGRCYENGELWENALNTYDRFGAMFEHETDAFLEALVRSGEICHKRKDFVKASDYYERAVDKYTKATESGLQPDPYMTAQAQFMLGELQLDLYKAVKLEPPIDKSLQRKQGLFNDILATYKDAALYQVGEWYTAASFRIGEVYEEFGRAFWESPRPANISEEVLAKYENQLALKIRPFKERAYETYQGTLRQAEENGIANSWVDKSRARAHVLAVDLGYETPATSPANGEAPPPADGAATGANGNGHGLNTATAKSNQ
jgi:tetratricopeptide (TPR) repeat protein